jgi:hypothetical protein
MDSGIIVQREEVIVNVIFLNSNEKNRCILFCPVIEPGYNEDVFSNFLRLFKCTSSFIEPTSGIFWIGLVR